MVCHRGVWGGRKREQVRGLEGIGQATELAAKGDNPAQVLMGPASSSQASPGAIPRPAWPLTGGQPPRQPGDEGSQGGESPQQRGPSALGVHTPAALTLL